MKKTSKKRIEEIIISKHILIEGGNDTDRFMVVPYKELTTALLDAGLVFKDSIVLDEDEAFNIMSSMRSDFEKKGGNSSSYIMDKEISKELANTNIFKIEE